MDIYIYKAGEHGRSPLIELYNVTEMEGLML